MSNTLAKPLKVGKYCEDDRGNMFMLLSVRGDKARVESVATKDVYTCNVNELTRVVMEGDRS